MQKRDYLSILDLSIEETREVINLGFHYKMEFKKGKFLENVLNNRTIALIFEKPSLRTIATFQIAITQLGGYALNLEHQSVRMGQREPVKDVARNLDKWVNGIVSRVYSHQTLIELAKYTTIPVINALSDLEHPCQALADTLTIFEITNFSKDFTLTFIGDGNNVSHSLMLISSYIGNRFIWAGPNGYEPNREIYNKSIEISKKTGAKIEITNDIVYAIKNSDFIYTDVWASMGQESEAEERKRIFREYQINSEILKYAPKGYKIMHCLPAHRDEEITDEVIESENSIVFQQAENRLHAQKGLIAFLYSK
ncbi:MAG: ornithine carbamoyltransferase [candidate division WOR-3 bacterium]|nr:ornithine carbamoyltransferase [candidate division WOR-3 bacterium]MCX7947871.1 ornithine carbamoyltransferase [candidate division WOR-3 bacterium]MDW8150693.1 ornithine carbamoyltransferase [candidate division WOR-3 bacterium]